MRLSNSKSITDEKTKAAFKGYVVTHINTDTRDIEERIPRVRAAIESGNFPEARKLIEEIDSTVVSLTQTLEIYSARTNVSLYTEEEMTKSAESIEKGYDEGPMLKKSRRSY